MTQLNFKNLPDMNIIFSAQKMVITSFEYIVKFVRHLFLTCSINKVSMNRKNIDYVPTKKKY